MSDASTTSYPGHQSPSANGSDATRHAFAHEQSMTFTRTKMIGKIVAVHANKDNPLLPPTVDWQPLVKQVDGAGGTTSHGIVYGTSVKRTQTGDAVIIMDPIVGDVGEFNIHDRDISAAVSGQAEAPPGSNRRFSPSDATYHGTVGSKATPNHYIQVQRDQNNNVTSFNFISSATLNLNGVKIDPKGNISAPGDVTAGAGTSDSVTLQSHLHTKTQPGNGNSGPPEAGT